MALFPSDGQGKDPNRHVRFIQDAIGPDFMRTMNLQMVAGQEFPSDGTYDSVGCIVNETAVKLMGYKDPIGKPVFRWKLSGAIS